MNEIETKILEIDREEVVKMIDENDFIPEFMELESTNVEDIEELVTKLGFKIEDCKNWGGHELLNYYKKRIL